MRTDVAKNMHIIVQIYYMSIVYALHTKGIVLLKRQFFAIIRPLDTGKVHIVDYMPQQIYDSQLEFVTLMSMKF